MVEEKLLHGKMYQDIKGVREKWEVFPRPLTKFNAIQNSLASEDTE